MDFRIASHELRLDASLSQIGAHSEIGDASYHGDRGGDVVEHPMGTRLGIRKSNKDEGSCKHHRADGLDIMRYSIVAGGECHVQNTSLSHEW